MNGATVSFFPNEDTRVTSMAWRKRWKREKKDLTRKNLGKGRKDRNRKGENVSDVGEQLLWIDERSFSPLFARGTV